MRVEIFGQGGEIVSLNRPPRFCVVTHGLSEKVRGDQNRDQQERHFFHDTSAFYKNRLCLKRSFRERLGEIARLAYGND
jgi:hypothetical protein